MINVHVSPIFVCAAELPLTVALVVFVMLTILLTAILILLCVSKSFRAFFFREREQSSKPANDDPARSNSQTAKTVPAEPATAPAKSIPTEIPAAQKPIRRKKRDDVFGGIPTIPLTFYPADDSAPTGKPATKRKNSIGGITVDIPAISAPDERTVYTPRTIGRNRADSIASDEQASRGKKHTPRKK